MMMNLFVVFDPVSFFGLSLNWIIMGIIFMMIPMKYYMMSSYNVLSYKLIIFNMFKMFKEVSNPNYMGLVILSVMMFIYLALSNLIGLFPFIFTSSAHLMMTLGLGMVFWMSFFIMGWLKNFKNSAAHLVPEGSPMMLAPLMVLIESISHLIRPFTLSVRLAANMMAGHLIMGLLSSISLISLFGFLSSLMMQSILLILEFGVAIIQGFVFSILLLLYALEYY